MRIKNEFTWNEQVFESLKESVKNGDYMAISEAQTGKVVNVVKRNLYDEPYIEVTFEVEAKE